MPDSTNAFYHIASSAIRRYWWVCIALLSAGCSTTVPILDRPFLPESYRIDSPNRAGVINPRPWLTVLKLNHQAHLNRRILLFWKNGSFTPYFSKVQPLSPVYREDVANLSAFLNQLFTIYLVAIEPQQPILSGQLWQEIEDRLQCRPLTNIEIRFLMNTGISAPFSRKPLTMLLISSHELALQSGAIPVYPQIFSPFLRKQRHLPPLRDLEESNLFATKNKNRVYSVSTHGFIVCKRKSSNHQSKSKGPP